MKHEREDYQRIQDSEGLIPENEPVFLIRGQDKIGALVVRMWAVLATYEGYYTDIIAAAFKQADLMDRWPKKKKADI